VETVLTGSTFTTVVSGADDLPPPMRIENYTQLTIKYAQENKELTRSSIVEPLTSGI